jgi:hypothetical protein
VNCGNGWRDCQDWNLGPHPYQGSAPELVSPRIAPATWANDVPLETVCELLGLMGCGPNVDQSALLLAAG